MRSRRHSITRDSQNPLHLGQRGDLPWHPLRHKNSQTGDIINIDVTVIKNGWHGDTGITMVPVGKVAPHAERLMRVTQECLYKGLALVNPALGWATLAKSFSSMRNHRITLW